MKKDRNSFYPNYPQQNNFMPNNNFFPNPGMQNIPQQMPQMAQMPGPYNPNMVPEQMNPYGGYPAYPEDYETRIMKIEKSLRRLETKIAKIESKGGSIINDDDITSSTNMYMI